MKTRPFKMYAAIASAMLSSILVTNTTELGPVGVGVVTALIAGLAVYLVPNPEKY